MSKPLYHGHIDLQFGYGPFNRKVRVYGGPAETAPKDLYTLNLRAEAPDIPADQYLPINDFGTPTELGARGALAAFIETGIERGEIFVGCWGGTGRTGLFMALAAKAAGDPDPIKRVRDDYKPGAVENVSQEDFITDCPVEDLRKEFNRAGFIRSLQFWKK